MCLCFSCSGNCLNEKCKNNYKKTTDFPKVLAYRNVICLFYTVKTICICIAKLDFTYFIIFLNFHFSILHYREILVICIYHHMPSVPGEAYLQVRRAVTVAETFVISTSTVPSCEVYCNYTVHNSVAVYE